MPADAAKWKENVNCVIDLNWYEMLCVFNNIFICCITARHLHVGWNTRYSTCVNILEGRGLHIHSGRDTLSNLYVIWSHINWQMDRVKIGSHSVNCDIYNYRRRQTHTCGRWMGVGDRFRRTYCIHTIVQCMPKVYMS